MKRSREEMENLPGSGGENPAMGATLDATNLGITNVPSNGAPSPPPNTTAPTTGIVLPSISNGDTNPHKYRRVSKEEADVPRASMPGASVGPLPAHEVTPTRIPIPVEPASYASLPSPGPTPAALGSPRIPSPQQPMGGPALVLGGPLPQVPSLQPTAPPPQTTVLPPATALPPVVSAPPPPPANQRQMKFENALDFLDQVKLQFAQQPQVYNQFLDIMKDFKTQSIDTPGVIARVSELFRGHTNLIRGFNTFLPPGYKIDIPEDEPRQKPQPEFDHARNYVKKIKTRFANQPHIYKAFLEILHIYHNEQRTIKEVYDQVAQLFQDHADLLDEFLQFLPDTGATEPGIAPRTTKSRSAGASAATRPSSKKEKKDKERARSAAMSATSSKRNSARKASEMIKKQTHEIVDKEPSTPPQHPASPASPSPGNGGADSAAGAVAGEKAVPNGSYEDINFFITIKKRLGNAKLYNEFLKCLVLFSHDIIGRLELVLLVRDILGRCPDLFEKFKSFIGFTDPLEDFESAGESGGAERRRSSSPSRGGQSSEIDFSACKRYGPSYIMPKNASKPKCTGRTELCNEVLNDVWVSVPTGSEDHTFKNSRKNQYEELLFKCEDDRYELDLVIEINAATIKVLEAMQMKLDERAAAGQTPTLNPRTEIPLDTLHIKNIERIYGDKGADIIDALYTVPVVAVPMLLKRLRQKDVEWRKVRKEWNRVWGEVHEKNYYKSLDHQGFAFKQNEKKALSTKVLVAEIKQKYQERLRALEKQGGTAAAATAPHGPHLRYSFVDTALFGEIAELVAYVSEKVLTKSDRERVDTFMNCFVHTFFMWKPPPGTATAPSSERMDIDSPAMASASPVATAAAPANQSAPSQPLDGRPAYPQLFFGNTPFYVFFRLYQILYERLQRAKELAREEGDKGKSKLSPLLAAAIAPHRQATHTPATPEEKYRTFKTQLFALIDGAIDAVRFEDDCRELFGISSYTLFTIDKLVAQLAKQAQAVVSSELSAKLMALHTYEASRTNRGFVEAVYHALALDLLRDERCFRFGYDPRPPVGSGEFTIQLMDAANQPRFAELAKEKWAQYIDQYVQSDVSTIDARKHHIFLLRNQRKNMSNRAMEGIEVHTGLECKLCLTTYRLFYVANTEDYLYRRGKGRRAVRASTKRSEKFKQWLTVHAPAPDAVEPFASSGAASSQKEMK